MNSKSTYRFIISGGGTGGHLFPAIAIAKALESLLSSQKVEILFIGAKHKIEEKKIPELGYAIKTLHVVGLPRNKKSPLKMIEFGLKILWSLFIVKKTIKQFKPDAVIGVGGYASFPTLYMAQKMNIPNFIQEQNAFMGVVNKILAPKSTMVFGGYPAIKNLPSCNFKYTGNPIRKEFKNIHTVDREKALQRIGLQKDKLTLFIVGGSQGSVKINQAILQIIDKLVEKDIQILWQTGETSFHEIQNIVRNRNYTNVIYPCVFINHMEEAYAVSDLIISRSGALSIAEISAVQKPVILIPLPTAAEDHQTYNANILHEAAAAIHLPEKEMSDRLLHEIVRLIEHKELRERLSINIASLSIHNADHIIAEDILKKVQHEH